MERRGMMDNRYCIPLLKHVGAFLHDAIREAYPISGKTALVRLKREDISWDKTYRYAVPRTQRIDDGDISLIAPPPDIVTVTFTQWAQSANSYRFAVGYAPSIDTVFVA